MMLEKTPPTLKINPKTRSNNPVTARQMIKAVLEQQEQQVPSDLFFDGIVDERRTWIVGIRAAVTEVLLSIDCRNV